LSTAESWKPLFHRYVRLGLTEYAAAISIILFIGLPHVGQLATLEKSTLPVSTSFRPTDPDRTAFFVQFWKLPVGWIFAALVPGVIITVLFFFDHEVSSIICTIDRYGTKKPGGFAWDIVLLGMTTSLCGILGIPPANDRAKDCCGWRGEDGSQRSSTCLGAEMVCLPPFCRYLDFRQSSFHACPGFDTDERARWVVSLHGRTKFKC